MSLHWLVKDILEGGLWTTTNTLSQTSSSNRLKSLRLNIIMAVLGSLPIAQTCAILTGHITLLNTRRRKTGWMNIFVKFHKIIRLHLVDTLTS